MRSNGRKERPIKWAKEIKCDMRGETKLKRGTLHAVARTVDGRKERTIKWKRNKAPIYTTCDGCAVRKERHNCNMRGRGPNKNRIRGGVDLHQFSRNIMLPFFPE